jgi:uncharacterized protein YgbK (DUF1537 family)
LRKKLPLADVQIDLEQLITDYEDSVQHCLHAMLQAIHTHRILVLRPAPEYCEEHRLTMLRDRYQLSMEHLANILRKCLGELSARIVCESTINTLIVTGGDTAIGVCSALGLNTLTISEELLPGIPLSYATDPHNNGVKVITKAGGFGQSETFYALYQKLIHERKSTS